MILLDIPDRLHSTVDAKVLVVLGDQFLHAARVFRKQDEVLHQIEQVGLVTDASDHRFQANLAFFAFVIDLFPFGKVFPLGGQATDATLTTVTENDKGVVPEELGDGVFVVLEVVVEGVFDLLV